MPDQLDSDGNGLGDACPCPLPSEAASDLVFLDRVTLSWSPTPSVDADDLYAGTIAAGSFSFNHVCRAPGLESTVATVSETPAPGRRFTT